MMQGDAYYIPIAIETDCGPSDGGTFADVEITIGTISKRMSTGDITYSEEAKAFLFPVTQSETLKLKSDSERAQVRVKCQNGDVIGCRLPDITVEYSVSRTVL